jgi:CheY-like chemotaxis protein
MNLEETRKYIERRMSDVGLSIRIDGSGYQAIQNFTRGDTERLNQLYYKLVSVGSRQERREVNGVTIQIAIDDLRRMDQFMDHMPMKIEQGEKVDTDRITIEQLASSLEQKVAEEIEAAVAEARKRRNGSAALDPGAGGNGADHAEVDLGEVAIARETAEPAGKPHILVVDDSPTIRAAVTKALEKDFELVEASDGVKGWETLCTDSKIKLVVTDLMMPNMDGFGLIGRIRSAKIPGVANLPIIVVTALEDPQAKVHALVAGANDFITKRTDTLELQARVVARYQLSQIVGNPLYAGGARGQRDAAPQPHEIASALLGTRSPAMSRASIASAARRHGKNNHAQAASDPMNTSLRHHGLERADAAKRSSGGAWARALARVSPTTAITLVASFLVLGAIVGILYVDRLPTELTAAPGEASDAVAAARDPAPPSADPASATASSQETAPGADEAKASDTPNASSWTTADGAPAREKLDPTRDETPKDEAPKEPVKIAVTQPTPEPLTPRATTDVDTKPPPARVRSEHTVAPAAKKPVADPATRPSVAAKAALPAPKRSAPAVSALADVETKPAPVSASAASAATSDPVSVVRAPMADTTAALTPKPVPAPTVSPSEPITGSTNAAPDSLVALAQPPHTMSDLASSKKLTQAELTNLVHRFVFVYQAGDLQQFLSLFDDNIHTNDRTNKAGLREDYQDLFRSTSMRQMTLDDITWDIKDQSAEGAANFEVRVRRVNDNQVRVYHGSLTFHVEKIGGRPRIVRMYHGQWKAQS